MMISLNIGFQVFILNLSKIMVSARMILKNMASSDNELNQIKEKNIQQHFFSYYHKWLPQENYYYAVEHTGFEANPVAMKVHTVNTLA